LGSGRALRRRVSEGDSPNRCLYSTAKRPMTTNHQSVATPLTDAAPASAASRSLCAPFMRV
jgi:hypothetical protein